MKHLSKVIVLVVGFILSCFVIGNSCATLALYALKKGHLTAWTGIVPQSTPSAVNDLALAIIALFLCVFVLRCKP